MNLLKRFLTITLCFGMIGCASVQKNEFDATPPLILDGKEPVRAPIQAASRETIASQLSLAYDESQWTKKEKIAFTLSTIANVADLATSVASDERCVERNPLLGKSPSDASLIVVKLLAIGFEYWVYNSPRFENQETHWFGYTSTAIHAWNAYSNSRNNCY